VYEGEGGSYSYSRKIRVEQLKGYRRGMQHNDSGEKCSQAEVGSTGDE
jgi:hypothetical protein